jgi:hypothetical protein
MKTGLIKQDDKSDSIQEFKEVTCTKEDVNSYIKYGLRTKNETTQLSFCDYIKQEKNLENNVLIWIVGATIEPYKDQKSRDCKGLNFEGVLFENVTFESCDLTEAKFNDTHGEITFKNSKIAGVDFTGSEVETHFGPEYRTLGTEYFKDAKFHFTEETVKEIDEAKKNSIITEDSQLANIVINPNWKDNVILPPKPNQLKSGRVDVEVYLTETDFKNTKQLQQKFEELQKTSIDELETKKAELIKKTVKKEKELIKATLEAKEQADGLHAQYENNLEQLMREESNHGLIKPLNIGYENDLFNRYKLSSSEYAKELDIEKVMKLRKSVKEFEDKYEFGKDKELQTLLNETRKIDSDLLTLHRNEDAIENYEHYKNNKQLSFKGVCEDLVFEDVDFSKIDLNGIDFDRCKFNNCKFGNKIEKSNFRECIITKATGSLRFENSDVSFLKTLDSDFNLRIKGGKTDYLNIENKGTTKISDANCEGMKYKGADLAALSLTNVDWNNGKLDNRVSTLELHNLRVNQNTDFTSMNVLNDGDKKVTWNGETLSIQDIQNKQLQESSYWMSKIKAYANTNIGRSVVDCILQTKLLNETIKESVKDAVANTSQNYFKNNKNIRSAAGAVSFGAACFGWQLLLALLFLLLLAYQL